MQKIDQIISNFKKSEKRKWKWYNYFKFKKPNKWNAKIRFNKYFEILKANKWNVKYRSNYFKF